jgi:TPR repeat protein
MLKAASQLHSGAMTTLGFMYKDGWKVPQDYIEAHKWF